MNGWKYYFNISLILSKVNNCATYSMNPNIFLSKHEQKSVYFFYIPQISGVFFVLAPHQLRYKDSRFTEILLVLPAGAPPTIPPKRQTMKPVQQTSISVSRHRCVSLWEFQEPFSLTIHTTTNVQVDDFTKVSDHRKYPHLMGRVEKGR